MAVLAIKNEPKCKLCKHEKRSEIDELLERRSNLERDENKQLVWTLPKVLEQLAEWGIPNPTEENVKNHWRKHCEKITPGQKERAQSVALELIRDLKDGAAHADTDENLRLIGSLWRAQIEESIANGDVPKVPHDVMLKAAAELTRRQSSETQHTLLTMFVGATGEALKTIAGAKPQIEAPVVIDQEADEAEYVPIETGEAA